MPAPTLSGVSPPESTIRESSRRSISCQSKVSPVPPGIPGRYASSSNADASRKSVAHCSKSTPGRTRMAFMNGRANCLQNTAVSSPWNCSIASGACCSTDTISPALESTKSPTGITNGGSRSMIAAAVSGVTYRELGRQNTNPTASAPASAAASASSTRVIPQILIRVRGLTIAMDATRPCRAGRTADHTRCRSGTSRRA